MEEDLAEFPYFTLIKVKSTISKKGITIDSRIKWRFEPRTSMSHP